MFCDDSGIIVFHRRLKSLVDTFSLTESVQRGALLVPRVPLFFTHKLSQLAFGGSRVLPVGALNFARGASASRLAIFLSAR